MKRITGGDRILAKADQTLQWICFQVEKSLSIGKWSIDMVTERLYLGVTRVVGNEDIAAHFILYSDAHSHPLAVIYLGI